MYMLYSQGNFLRHHIHWCSTLIKVINLVFDKLLYIICSFLQSNDIGVVFLALKLAYPIMYLECYFVTLCSVNSWFIKCEYIYFLCFWASTLNTLSSAVVSCEKHQSSTSFQVLVWKQRLPSGDICQSKLMNSSDYSTPNDSMASIMCVLMENRVM